MPPSSPLSFFPFKNSVFIFTEGVLRDFFTYDKEGYSDVEFLLDYTKYISTKAYLCASLHTTIRNKMKSNGASHRYLDSLICNGAHVTGDITFGREEDDIIFLSGMLALTESPSPKQIIIIKKSDDALNFKDKPSADVIKELKKKGLKQLEIKPVKIQSLVEVIKELDTDFMGHVSSLFSGTV